jgi:hypothetical protein
MLTRISDFLKTVETKKLVTLVGVVTLCTLLLLIGALVPAVREYEMTVSKPLISNMADLVK